MEITITEDQALAYDVSLLDLILDKEKQGFREVFRYQHPAVGTVVIMRNNQ
jgi:hypothetical protein